MLNTRRAPAPAWLGWHPGETAVQKRLGLTQLVSPTAVVDQLPRQHQLFYATRLHYLPVVTLDATGRPWASILTAKDGFQGFIKSDSAESIHIDANVWNGDPICQNMKSNTEALFAGVGVEPSTARRNKFGGVVHKAQQCDGKLELDIRITYSLGLCPKYIAERELQPHAGSRPRTLQDSRFLESRARLPAEAIALILAADTAYLATTFVPSPEVASEHKARVGINHRGGRPGFVRVRNDGRTLVLPNYAGNRVVNSLGNIHYTPLASLVFPSFETGSILYVTGDARTLYGEEARTLMPESNVLTTLTVTGFSLVADALPLRHVHSQISAYSPPVRFLAEEPPVGKENETMLRLVRTAVRAPTLTTYFFRAPAPLQMKPAGTVVLDLRAAFADAGVGYDDCVRTWTVSHPPVPDAPDEFGVTLRTKSTGILTPLMAAAARMNPNPEGASTKEITAKLRGTNSDIPQPEPGAHLWIAGGIGATPFLALGRHIAHLPGPWDIVLLLSTAEPAVIVALFAEAFASALDVRLEIHLCTHQAVDVANLGAPSFATVQVHPGRIPTNGKLFEELGAKDRKIHICGPLPFVTNAMVAMDMAGVDPEKVFRERFTY